MEDFEDEHHDFDHGAYEQACRDFASEEAWHAYRVLRLVRDLPAWRDVSQPAGTLMTVLDRVELKTVLAVLREEVIPWLLEDHDLVRERFEAR